MSTTAIERMRGDGEFAISRYEGLCPDLPPDNEDWCIEPFERERGERAAAILRRVDGKRALGDLAVDCGWRLDEANAAIQDLYHLAVVQDAGDAYAPAPSFQRHVVNLGCRRMHQLRSRVGLMSRLCSGKASRRLLVGWLVESYHYVSAAASHLSPAIVVAPSERVRMMLSEYLSQEYSHEQWLRGGGAPPPRASARLAACRALLDRVATEVADSDTGGEAAPAAEEGDADQAPARQS